MTIGNVSGVDYRQWLSNGVTTNPNITSAAIYEGQSYGNEVNGDSYVSIGGETCTDGKDDGKIGFFGAIGNAIKGIGKTAVNMVKGCFTNKEGKFSLGKTLLTLGTAALCVAVPAVGLVACGVGAVTGGIQIGKGIYKAATAKTDAEAKLAWQDVGGGALVTGLSVAGAKASYSAVMKTSTAGATASLGKDASLLAKGKALVADMKSSTVNSASAIKTAASQGLANAKAALKEANPAQAVKDGAKTAAETVKDGAKTAAEAVKDGAKTAAEAVKDAVKNPKTTVKTIAQSTKNLFNKVKSSITKENIAAAASKLKGTAKNIANQIAEGKASLDELVAQYGYEDVMGVLEVLGATQSV